MRVRRKILWCTIVRVAFLPLLLLSACKKSESIEPANSELAIGRESNAARNDEDEKIHDELSRGVQSHQNPNDLLSNQQLPIREASRLRKAEIVDQPLIFPDFNSGLPHNRA